MTTCRFTLTVKLSHYNVNFGKPIKAPVLHHLLAMASKNIKMNKLTMVTMVTYLADGCEGMQQTH